MTTAVLVFLAGGVYILAGWWLSGRFGNSALEPADPDSEPSTIGESGTAETAFAFDTAVRGYRMDEVDAAISELQAQVRNLKNQLAGMNAPSIDVNGGNPAGLDIAASATVAQDTGGSQQRSESTAEANPDKPMA